MEAEKWDVKNHGGNPTTNESKKYAIFVGRFQPYHQGHISLIMQKINEGIPALIMVRDIAPDAKNPFTTEQTVEMIEKYHAAKGHDVKVLIIPDMESVNSTGMVFFMVFFIFKLAYICKLTKFF